MCTLRLLTRNCMAHNAVCFGTAQSQQPVLSASSIRSKQCNVQPGPRWSSLVLTYRAASGGIRPAVSLSEGGGEITAALSLCNTAQFSEHRGSRGSACRLWRSQILTGIHSNNNNKDSDSSLFLYDDKKLYFPDQNRKIMSNWWIFAMNLSEKTTNKYFWKKNKKLVGVVYVYGGGQVCTQS